MPATMPGAPCGTGKSRHARVCSPAFSGEAGGRADAAKNKSQSGSGPKLRFSSHVGGARKCPKWLGMCSSESRIGGRCAQPAGRSRCAHSEGSREHTPGSVSTKLARLQRTSAVHVLCETSALSRPTGQPKRPPKGRGCAQARAGLEGVGTFWCQRRHGDPAHS